MTMVEKVARAIASSVLGHDYDSLYADKREWLDDRGSRHDVNVPYKSDCLEGARAAIEAMREPTGVMIDAGAETYEFTAGQADVSGQPSKSYKAMLRAALKPAPPTPE